MTKRKFQRPGGERHHVHREGTSRQNSRAPEGKEDPGLPREDPQPRHVQPDPASHHGRRRLLGAAVPQRDHGLQQFTAEKHPQRELAAVNGSSASDSEAQDSVHVNESRG